MFTVTEPSFWKQVGDTLTKLTIPNVGTVDIVAGRVLEHPVASVIVNEYVPSVNPLILVVIAPVDQTYVNGGLPVKPVTYIVPVFPAAQFELPIT